jgi:lipopolysaccharide/colanic/teichoic acid biosynthesis glycosyltransferase
MSNRPSRPQAATSMPKRLLDVAFAATGILLSSPLWLIAAIAIKLEDAGPVLFSQERSGMDGRIFHAMKFRSMRANASGRDPRQAVRFDPRVTRVGRVMRATAFDELPQLWNILIGDMSVVGHGTGAFERLEDIPGYRERAQVRPGLTGLAQLYAARNLPRRLKFRYDRLYIRAYSFTLDLRLILLSVWVSLSGRWETRGRPVRRRPSLREPANRA